MLTKDEFDFMTDLAEPLPVIAIAELLGVGAGHHEDFVRWSEDVMRSVNRPQDPEVIAGIRRTIEEFRSYFLGEIAARRRNPGDDLMSRLVRLQQEDKVLSEYDVLALCVIILMAGNETTRKAMGSTLVALLDHPDQLALLQKDPALLPQAIEEGVRYDSPILGVPRVAMQETTVADVALQPGQVVMIMWGMANRDPRRFQDPDRFDVLRNPTDHLGFGVGNHFCLGAPLARRELKMALSKVLFECPALGRVSPTTEWDPAPLNRGPARLPLRWAR
jgi:cytochrome P450